MLNSGSGRASQASPKEVGSAQRRILDAVFLMHAKTCSPSACGSAPESEYIYMTHIQARSGVKPTQTADPLQYKLMTLKPMDLTSISFDTNTGKTARNYIRLTFLTVADQRKFRLSLQSGPTMSDTTKTQVAFISGHTDLTQDEFQCNYIPRHDTALQDGHIFILGDAAGVDTLALTYLLSDDLRTKYPDILPRVKVFASRKHNISRLRSLGIEVIGPDDPCLPLRFETWRIWLEHRRAVATLHGINT